MICFYTTREGGRWHQTDAKIIYYLKTCGVKFAAIRVGNWIYDFVLAELNKEIAKQNAFLKATGRAYREPYYNPVRHWSSE